MARVLIGYSACPLTRAAFEAQGHEAWTCDLLPARDNSAMHLQGDVWDYLYDGWDFSILHPMCTYMNVASSWALRDPDFDRYPGVGYHMRLKPGTLTGKARREAQAADVENFARLMSLPFPVAIENPAPSSLSTRFRKPNQIIHPHQFGDDASKGTGLWLSDGVPLLTGTLDVLPRWVLQPSGKRLPRWANQTDSGQNRLTPGEQRWLDRSENYPGIAAAMGYQWGKWLNGLK